MIRIRCIRGAGDREMDPVRDDLITTEHLAALRGAHELDQLYYDRTTRRIRTPYAAIMDGAVVRVADPLVADGNYLVQGLAITIEASGKITQALDLEGDYTEPLT